MDNGQYQTHSISEVVAVCRGIVIFFAAMAALYVLVGLFAKGNLGSPVSIVLILVLGIAAAGLAYLHFTNDTIHISESGIETRGYGNIKWQDISKVTVTKRIHVRSQRVDTIICIFHGQKGMFKISSSPEETDQILLLLKRYIEDKLIFNEASA